MPKRFTQALYRFLPWETRDELRRSIPSVTHDEPVRLYGGPDTPALDLGIKFTTAGLIEVVALRHTFWDQPTFEKGIRDVAEHMGVLGLTPIRNEHRRPKIRGQPRPWTRRTWCMRDHEQVIRETRLGNPARAVPHQVIVVRRFTQPAAAQRPHADLSGCFG